MSDAIIDVNAHLSRWPTRRLREDEPETLVAKLHSYGVTEAWVSSFDGVLHKDIAAVNDRLVQQCQQQTKIRLVPCGVINPTLPAWEEDFQRCIDQHKMRCIRLYANYHGYGLDDSSFVRLLNMAATHEIVVSLCTQMEDQRTMHRLLQVKPVDLKPLEALLPKLPSLKLIILNAGKSMLPQLNRFTRHGNVFMDISMLDGLASVEDAIQDMSLERVLFGSHSPLLYFESALFKLKEAKLAQAALRAIQFDNARSLIA